MIRIGVDVGGTNTDAVVMRDTEFLAGAKSPTTPDVLGGVRDAIAAAIARAGIAQTQVDAVMVGTTTLRVRRRSVTAHVICMVDSRWVQCSVPGARPSPGSGSSAPR